MFSDEGHCPIHHTAEPQPNHTEPPSDPTPHPVTNRRQSDVPKILTSKMMEESVVVTTDESDSFDESYDRPAERWAPLGAPLPTPPPSMSGECRSVPKSRRHK